MTNNANYSNFNNHRSYNGLPLQSEQILVPVVLNQDMKTTLSSANPKLNYDYVETWKYGNNKVPVAFVPVPDIPGYWEQYKPIFNEDVKRYINHSDFGFKDTLSLDEMIRIISDDDFDGYDPTGTNVYELDYYFSELLDQLISELDRYDKEHNTKYACIINMIATTDLKKKDIIEKIDLGTSKTQSYESVKKAMILAEKIIKEHLL